MLPILYTHTCCGRVFENKPNEICSHLSEKGLDKHQDHSSEGKGTEKEKEGGRRKKEKKKKSNGCTLSFYNGYFGDTFCGQKLLLDGTGLFSGNLLKKPVRYSYYSFMYSLPTIILTENLMGLRLVS